jgi:hypothetical protein
MNYEMMKQSEIELQTEFNKFCDHVIFTWQSILKNIKNNKTLPNDVNEIHKLEDQSNLFEAQIQDECI